MEIKVPQFSSFEVMSPRASAPCRRQWVGETFTALNSEFPGRYSNKLVGGAGSPSRSEKGPQGTEPKLTR